MMRAVIIGSGNVAEALARALPQAGVSVVQIAARNRERGAEVAALAGAAYTCDLSQTAGADIYIAAVSDRAVGEVFAPVTLPEGAVAVHVSGAQPLEALPAKFARRGVVYPLQTFTAGREVDFAEIPMFIEGSDPATTEFLKTFAGRLSRKVSIASSEQRARIHLAGVFACNFVNAMYAAGGDVLRGAEIPFGVLGALIAETARKAAASGDPRTVQTGPAVRGDVASMRRHAELLTGDERLRDIYEMISEYIYERKL